MRMRTRTRGAFDAIPQGKMSLMNQSAAIGLLVGTSISTSFVRVLVLRCAVRVPCATTVTVSPSGSCLQPFHNRGLLRLRAVFCRTSERRWTGAHRMVRRGILAFTSLTIMLSLDGQFLHSQPRLRHIGLVVVVWREARADVMLAESTAGKDEKYK
jgi:hypothetical protein